MNRSTGNRVFAGLAAAASLLMVSTANAQDITLEFANWATAEQTTQAGMQQVIDAFEEANPGIKIESQTVAFAEMARQLVLRVRSGNPPDVAQIAGNDTFVLAASGGLEPLGEYAGSDVINGLKKGSFEALQVDGKMIAFPWNQAPAGFWFNKELMEGAGLDPENPPATIEELNTALAAIKEANPDIIPLGMDTTNRAFSLSSNWPWMLAFGAKPVGEGATGAESPEMIAYLEWMRSLAKNGYIDLGRKIGEFRPLIAQGQVAFLWDQVLVQGVIQSASGIDDETFNATFGVAPMPAGASGSGYSFEGGHQLIMFADSEHKEAAWKFIKYLATDEEAAKVYTIGTNRSIPPAAEFQDPEIAKMLSTPVIDSYSKAIIPTIAPQPYGADFSEAATAIMAGVQEAVTSDIPIAEIAANIQSQLDR
jgi:multiple sugar transport system substrate-binding protein